MKKCKQKIVICSIILLAIFNTCSYSQSLSTYDYHKNTETVLTPNASSLQKFGDIPVDLYTGTANISVPLTTIHDGEISIPILLSYNATGVVVSEIPGWAGLNWNLMCGGQIRRKVNYINDEFDNASLNAQGINDKGYYFTGSTLNNSQWNTVDFMKNKLNEYNINYYGIWNGMVEDLEPDEFQFNFGNYSGSFYRSETGQWKVKSKQDVSMEIESTIDNSHSYELYTYNDNPTKMENVSSLFTKFVITTPDGFKYVFGSDQKAIEFSRGMIYGLPGHEAFSSPIEDRKNYITANAWNLTQIITPSGDTVKFNYKKGKAIFNTYKLYYPEWQDGTEFGQQLPVVKGNVINPSYLESIETHFQKIEFVTSNAVELNITPNLIFYQNYPYSIADTFKKTLTYNWKDLNYATSDPNSDDFPDYNQQLDQIKVFDKKNNQYTYVYKLYQSADNTRRRTLDSLGIIDYSTGTESKYKFSYYNVGSLPSYESLGRDHYGLYNGGSNDPYYSTTFPNRFPNPGFSLYGLLNKITYPSGGETEFQFESGSYASAIKVDPNSTPAVQLISETGSAGIRIKKIINTPGYGQAPITTEYIYKKNYTAGGTTSSGILALKLPTTTNGLGGYIDKIIYNIDWGNGYLGTSVCDGAQGVFAYNITDDNSEWLGMVKDGPIAYSEVAVKKADGSLSVYKFSSNEDAQNQDEIYDQYASANADWLGSEVLTITQQSNYRLTSNDLERGKLLSEEYYDNTSQKVKDITYEYTNAADRKNNYIKAFAHKELFTPQHCGNFFVASVPRGWTYRIYYYKNPIKTVTETDYNGNQSIATTKEYQYDDYGNITQEVTYKSTGEKIQTDTRYNSNADYLGTATGSTAIGIKNLFTNYHIKNYAVEQTTLQFPAPSDPPVLFAQKFTAATLYLYNQTRPVVSNIYKFELDNPSAYYSGTTPTYSPSKITSGNLVYDSRYKLQESIPDYSASFNKPLTVSDIQKSTAYTWDNNTHYVSSETENAVDTEVAYCNFEGTYTSGEDENKGNWEFTNDYLTETDAPMGSACFRLAATYGMGALTQLQTKYALPAGKSYILSFWVKGTYYPNVYNGIFLQPAYSAKKTLANGWSYYEVPLNGSNVKITITQPTPPQPISTVSPIDEVRLYPADGAMKSYVYDAATGNITAACDASGNITHYEYDGLSRLINVKDEDGNIIKNYTYQTQGAQ